MSNSPIKLADAKKAVERARRECEKATESPWFNDLIGASEGCPNIQDSTGRMTVCNIRGWGYLTGTGGRGLREADAIAVQSANAVLICLMRSLVEPLLEILDDRVQDSTYSEVGIDAGLWYYPILSAIMTHFERVDGEGK